MMYYVWLLSSMKLSYASAVSLLLLMQFFVYWTSLCDWLNNSIQQLKQSTDSSSASDLEQFAVKLLVIVYNVVSIHTV